MRPWIVIPVVNEVASLVGVVAGALAHAPVLVVDDGSTDGSGEAARAAGAEVLRHARRLGKGQALWSGIGAARRRGATVVVTLDGDGQHDPADVPRLLDAARESPDALIVGGRLDHAAALPAGRLSAIRVAGFFVNWASGLAVEDTQSGFRAYPVALFDHVRTHRGGFVFETEVLVAAAERGWSVREVPVGLRARTAARSRFRPVADGAAIAGYLAGRAAARWWREGRAAATALVHARGAGLGAQLRQGWRRPRSQRAVAAGVAALAAPALAVLAVAHAVGGPRATVLLTRLVASVYTQRRLAPAPGHGLPPATPAPTLVTPPVPGG
jgi:hypothetical protein